MSKSLAVTFAATLSLSVGLAAGVASAGVVTHGGSAVVVGSGYSQQIKMGQQTANYVDFTVKNFTDFTNGGTYQSVYVPFFPGKVMTTGQSSQAFGYAIAARLLPGDVVGPATFSNSYYQPILASQTFGDGAWYGGTSAVEGAFGLAFANGYDSFGATMMNYAYVNIRVTPLPGQAADVEILGWSFETTPGVAITVASVPEPMSLGWLGLAAVGLLRRR